MATVVSATSCARRRLIRDVRRLLHMSMTDDAKAFVLRFRGTDLTLSYGDCHRLMDDSFHDAVCQVIYEANEPSDRSLIIQLFQEEIRLRRADQCHSGDRLILCAFLLALLREISDVPLLWEAKRIDFDMGCYFDGQLLAFCGLDATIKFLRQQSGRMDSEAADYLDGLRDNRDYEDIASYIKFKLEYYGLPNEPTVA